MGMMRKTMADTMKTEREKLTVDEAARIIDAETARADAAEARVRELETRAEAEQRVLDAMAAFPKERLLDAASENDFAEGKALAIAELALRELKG